MKSLFLNKNILITAGPTVEDIDPVRFISNRSSGKMGVALALSAEALGANVCLVHGPIQDGIIAPTKLTNIQCIVVRSTQDMFNAVMSNIQVQDIAIFAAAVCDYTPKEKAKNKIKKTQNDLSPLSDIHWIKTPDILASVAALPTHPFLVGFAAESEDLLENAKKKLLKCDAICANDISSSAYGFNSDLNKITLMTNNSLHEFPLMKKQEAATAILEQIAQLI